ncbi:MAG: nitronate monooxygenase [Proteobacteria bacterium]|nr:nitronate monooxygenase [Pseudomonadota bacterium]
MNKLDDFRLYLRKKEYIPIMIGGMGVDISTPKLALEGARLGGIAHISDALVCAIADRHFGTNFVKERFRKYKNCVDSDNKSYAQFDLASIEEATRIMVAKTMEAKKGPGDVFINLMEKLTMNNPRETLKARLIGALDGGIDGISLGAGLHLGSFDLMKDHPRFRDVKVGIIVSSQRALKLFLKKTARLGRAPDYVVVEGPLAGGHLGFGLDDWQTFDLKSITLEVMDFLKNEGLQIPVIPAGGIFTGTDATNMMELGASAVQVATRFAVTKESGLPDDAKQKFFQANEEDIVVNTISPTGYPMRMLAQSPCIGTGGKPNCKSMGYILDRNGDCTYIKAYNREAAKNPEKISIIDKTCLCTQMRAYRTWTCGHTTYRLKDTTNKLPDGTFQQLTVEQVFNDYLFSVDNRILLPELEVARDERS